MEGSGRDGRQVQRGDDRRRVPGALSGSEGPLVIMVHLQVVGHNGKCATGLMRGDECFSGPRGDRFFPNMFTESFGILRYCGRECFSHDILQGRLDGREGESVFSWAF